MKYISPFKWSGSKTKEIKRLRSLIGETGLRICEPFMGTGVVTSIFGKDDGCIANDMNVDVVNLLLHFRDKEFLDLVYGLMLPENMGSHDFFYETRAKFNLLEKNGPTRAALFFFLQNCAHFGLYRLNPKGEYTSTWHFFDTEPKLEERLASLAALSAKLSILRCQPYELFFDVHDKEIESMDLLFIDPPYLNASHKDYSVGKGAFTIEDYQFLDDWAGYAARKKGVRSIICNYSTPDDDIIYPNKESIVRFNSSRSMRLDNFIKRESIYVLYGFGNSLL